MADCAPVELKELVERLSGRDVVDGVVLLGSTATGTLRAVSDYDVLVVLSDPQPPVLVGLTTIGGRLTDLVFLTTAEIDELLAGIRPSLDAWTMQLAPRVREGAIAFDRNGRLERLRSLPIEPAADASRTQSYEMWFSINYNLAQNRRLFGSDDDFDRVALRLRLLYGVFEVLTGYFQLRGLPWRGEKAAVRYLSVHDPDYLQELRACLDETDVELRFRSYETLAEHSLRPVGGLWDPGETSFQFRPGTPVTDDLVAETRRFWESLVS